MSNEFNRFDYAQADIDISRSVLDLSHSAKMTMNVGNVVPILCTEVLPGDTWSIDTTKVVRLQPLVAPIMDNLYLDTYYFFVPNRLIWSHWVNFMGENTESAWHDTIEYSIPTLTIPEGGFKEGTIADYLGVPIYQGEGVEISALPFRAYAKVMADWFVDRNLQNPVYIYTGDSTVTGDNDSTQVNCYLGGKPFIASKYRDYFTSCMPQAQRGTEASFPLASAAPITSSYGTSHPVLGSIAASSVVAPVYGTSGVSISADGLPSDYSHPTYKSNNNGNVSAISASGLTGFNDNGVTAGFSRNGNNYGISTPFVDNYAAHIDIPESSINASFEVSGLSADLAAGSVFTVNTIRQAFAVQKYLERSARAGDRYISTIEAFFGVKSSDARMQMAEYLGGNRMPLNVSDVNNTTATTENVVPLGSPAGYSFTGDNNSDFTKSFDEHGYLIGVSVVRYKHTYQNGLPRHFSRRNIFDFYNPVFANLGERGTYNSELYLSDDNTVNNEIFGYNEAWSEYRYLPNRVHGEMRSNAPTSLDAWHLADDYSELPSLGDTWIREDKNPLDRCLAVTSSVSDQVFADYYFDISCARPMPMYSIPGLIDHH